MHPKLYDWLQKHGRKYAKFRVAGGKAYLNKDDNIPNHLSGQEWVEFFQLQGQFDILLELLVPKNKQKDILKQLNDLENEQTLIYEMTGTFNLPKGYA